MRSIKRLAESATLGRGDKKTLPKSAVQRVGEGGDAEM